MAEPAASPPPPDQLAHWLGWTDTQQDAEIKVTFNTRVRNRLEQLLGTDKLRLNDRQYMRTLMRRIYEDQEQSLQQRAEKRQMQENKRLKGLVEDMKMEKPPDMVESAFVVSFDKTKALMEKVQRKQFNRRHNIKKRKTVSCAELDSDDEASPGVNDLTTNEVFHHSSFIGATLDLSPEEDDSLAEEERQRELAKLAIKFGRYKEPLVQLLLQEGTVPRLYDLAEIILVKPPKLQKKKKDVVAEEEPVPAEVELDESASDSAEDDTGTEVDEEEEEKDVGSDGAEDVTEGNEAETFTEQTVSGGATVEGQTFADGEAPADDLEAEAGTTKEDDTTEGDETTESALPDTSEAEDEETAAVDGDEADESLRAAEDEVAPSEGDITAEDGGAATADESAAGENGGTAGESAQSPGGPAESP